MPLSAQGVQNVKSVLDSATSNPKTDIPGLVFLAVDKNGKELVSHASGIQGTDHKEPMSLNNTFWIASLTKVVTSIACMQLVEQGKLSLDDAEQVYKLAPELKEKKVLADGVNLMTRETDITLRMLLSHTAGFAYAFLDPRVQIDEFRLDEKEMLGSPLVNQPGSMWEYGINIDWAGVLLERVTGMKLGAYFKKYIFEPMGLKNIALFPDQEMKKTLLPQHQRDPLGNLTERENLAKAALKAETSEEQDKLFNSGGGGLFAKLTDYIPILATLLNNGTSPTTGVKLLSSETVDKMWENQIPKQPDFARGGPPPANPLLANGGPEMYPQEGNPPQGWNLLGFLTIAPGGTGRGAHTTWWAGLPNLYWWADRERGVAGLIGSQVLPYGDLKVIQAWAAAEKAVYDGLE